MAGLKEITSTERLLDIIRHRKDEIKKELLDVTFTRTAPVDPTNEPYSWSVTVDD